MNAAPRPSLAHLPRATSLVDACALQARYSCGRAGRHVIMLGACTDACEEYFAVSQLEAARLEALGIEAALETLSPDALALAAVKLPGVDEATESRGAG